MGDIPDRLDPFRGKGLGSESGPADVGDWFMVGSELRE